MVKTIVIDPGHGGRDPGAVADGLQEKDVTLRLAQEIQTGLLGYDCGVILTRPADLFLRVGNRAQIGNNLGADLFLSIHVNSFTSTAANGYESFTRVGGFGQEKEIQQVFHAEVAPVWTRRGRIDRGRKFANFTVLAQSRGPALLSENGFISNARDRELLRDEDFLTELAVAHVRGIAAAMNVTLRAG